MKQKILLRGVFITFVLFLVTGFAQFVSASSNVIENYLPQLKGVWYDLSGNPGLSFSTDSLNGYKIIDINRGDGHGEHISVRLIVNGEYKDYNLKLINFSSKQGNYHQYIAANNKIFRRTKMPQFNESVGGLGIGMSQKDVLQRYGRPEKEFEGSDTAAPYWWYQKLAMYLYWYRGMVYKIAIYRWGDRHFDKTGLNCLNSPADFANAYRMDTVPQGGNGNGPYAIGNNEYLEFNEYPFGIFLTMSF